MTLTLTFDPIDPKIESNGPRIITNHPTKFHAIRFKTVCVMRGTRIQINKWINTRRSKHNLPHFQCEGKHPIRDKGSVGSQLFVDTTINYRCQIQLSSAKEEQPKHLNYWATVAETKSTSARFVFWFHLSTTGNQIIFFFCTWMFCHSFFLLSKPDTANWQKMADQ